MAGDPLDLKWWGTRFRDAQTERAYREWEQREALPFIRVGMAVSLLNWALGLVGTAETIPELVPWLWPRTLAVSVFIGAVWFLTYVGRARRALFTLTAVANALAGLLIVGMASHGGSTAGGMGALVLIVFFAFTIFRLPLRYGAPATVSYVVAFEWQVAMRAVPLHFDAPEITFITLLPVIALTTGVLVGVVLERLSHNSYRQERVIEQQRAALEDERARADRLLHNVLPEPIAARLKIAPGVIADRFDQVTVLFADVVGFTPMAAALSPEKLVEVLNDVFTRFDALAERHGVEKIKTIGDAYMAVAGIPQARTDHASAAAALALDMRAALAELHTKSGFALRLRIGLCSGPAVAGVIGTRKFAYDLWGDTVNTAARMESHGSADCIHIAETTFNALGDGYRLTERGVVEIKGKGPMRTWFLEGRKTDAPVERQTQPA